MPNNVIPKPRRVGAYQRVAELGCTEERVRALGLAHTLQLLPHLHQVHRRVPLDRGLAVRQVDANEVHRVLRQLREARQTVVVVELH